MDEILRAPVEALTSKFGAEMSEDRSEVTLVVSPEQTLPALQALRDDFGFDFLIDVTAVDYWPAEMPRFHVIYHVLSTKNGQVLRMRALLNGISPAIPT